MFVALTNTPRDYAWGSTTAIAEFLGRPASGGPEAELWFGAHPEAPSREPHTGTGLDSLIRDDPRAALGADRDRLPFLLKLIAAERPLSLQAHPSTAQAQAGFARDNDAGLAPDDPARDYHDASAKPELLLALSPTFEALAGFRHLSESRLLLAELATASSGTARAAINGLEGRLCAGDPAESGSTGSSAHITAVGERGQAETTPAHSGEGNALKDTVRWLLERGDGVAELVDAVVAAARTAHDRSSFAREWDTVLTLAEEYPGDPGVVVSLLLNRITLQQGQAMYLPAGNLHSYLSGFGLELQASSDNTLRGGLTGKHVNIGELMDVVVFEALPTPAVTPDSPVPGVTAFRTDTDEFVLAQVALGHAGYTHGYRLTGPDSAAFTLTGPAIVLCTSGGVGVSGRRGTAQLGRGDAVFISPDEGTLTFAGSGAAFVATTP